MDEIQRECRDTAVRNSERLERLENKVDFLLDGAKDGRHDEWKGLIVFYTEVYAHIKSCNTRNRWIIGLFSGVFVGVCTALVIKVMG